MHSNRSLVMKRSLYSVVDWRLLLTVYTKREYSFTLISIFNVEFIDYLIIKEKHRNIPTTNTQKKSSGVFLFKRIYSMDRNMIAKNSSLEMASIVILIVSLI